MKVRVFQVDRSEVLEPYTFERAAIAEAGGELIVGNCTSGRELAAQARDCEILLLAWLPILTPDVLSVLPCCRLIVRWGIGYDMINVAAASKLGIAVANSPNYCIEDVAEHTIALLLASARRITWFQQRMSAGEWPAPMARPIHRIAGRALGVVGFGKIGSLVAARALGLGLRVLAHDPFRTEDDLRAEQVEPGTLDQVLSSTDFVTLHVPLTPETHHLIDASRLARMRPGSVLINASRGPVVDEVALIKALEAGQLSAAALDVFEHEPLAARNPLRRMEQVVLTPHMAHYSEESWQSLREEVCETVAEWIRTGWSGKVVNPAVRVTLRSRTRWPA